MGVGIFVILTFLGLIGIGFLIWWCYSIYTKQTIGIIVPILYFLFIGYLLSINILDEQSISKKDVQKDLARVNLQLNEPFEIIENEVTGFPERLQTTKLKVSAKDETRCITLIKNASNFIELDSSSLYAKPEEIINYKSYQSYTREFYTTTTFPTRIIVRINPKEHQFTYQIFED